MRRTPLKMALMMSLAAVVVLALGATAATAHGGGKGGRLGGASTTTLVNAGAKQLNITAVKLKAAIVASAVTRINEAQADEDIDADEGTELKEEVADNLRSAYSYSRASTVAKELAVTTAQLNTAFRAARKALIVAQIDDALEDGDIDADEAADLKAELEESDLPGYKQSRFGFGGGFGRGHHG